MNAILGLLVTVIAVSYAQPLDSSKDAKILKYENEIGDNGMYKFSFESSDGTIREESGELRNKGNRQILTVIGFYSYLDDKGERHDVNYIADDLGYRIIEKPVPRVTAFGAPPVNRIDPDVVGSLIGSGVG